MLFEGLGLGCRADGIERGDRLCNAAAISPPASQSGRQGTVYLLCWAYLNLIDNNETDFASLLQAKYIGWNAGARRRIWFLAQGSASFAAALSGMSSATLKAGSPGDLHTASASADRELIIGFCILGQDRAKH